MRFCDALVGNVFSWFPAIGERDTCVCKCGVSLVSQELYSVKLTLADDGENGCEISLAVKGHGSRLLCV